MEFRNNSSASLSTNMEELEFLTISKKKGKHDSWSPLDDGLTLTWKDLSVYTPAENVRDKGPRPPFKRVLNSVSGAMQPGTLVALMGASGAGKSTLMNALAFRNSPDVVVDGDIRINGRPIGQFMCDISGYVYQHDLFIGSLSAREHLYFMAQLKLSHCTSEQRTKRVHSLLRELGLTRCQNGRIGGTGDKGLSGGELKRLAFATEILTDPPILFCDEPTTGLDSYSARKLVTMMKNMALQGKTILCTIHQPSSEVFAMFDNLILLAEGRLAYMGRSQGALQYFQSFGYECPETFNPADFYISTLAVMPGHESQSKRAIQRLADNFAVSQAAQQIDMLIQYEMNLAVSQADYGLQDALLVDAYRHKANWFCQLFWLTWRSFVNSYRNPTVHFIRIVQKVGLALMIGLCYSGSLELSQTGIQNIQGAVFVLILESTYPPLYAVLDVFPSEFPVFSREHRNGIYTTSAYYGAKVLSMIPGFLLEPFLFATIAYWLIGLRPSFVSYAYTVFVLTLTTNTASACGMCFSAMFETMPMALIVLIPFDYILMITGGFLIRLQSLPWFANWTKYLSWFLYSNEALSIIQWRDVTNITCTTSAAQECHETGESVLESFSLNPRRFDFDVSAMMVLYMIFHVVGYLALHRRIKRRKS